MKKIGNFYFFTKKKLIFARFFGTVSVWSLSLDQPLPSPWSIIFLSWISVLSKEASWKKDSNAESHKSIWPTVSEKFICTFPANSKQSTRIFTGLIWTVLVPRQPPAVPSHHNLQPPGTYQYSPGLHGSQEPEHDRWENVWDETRCLYWYLCGYGQNTVQLSSLHLSYLCK